jgi:RNA methyltransferase, TrmH family
MSKIASPQNPRLKALRRLHTRRERARTGTFLVEGEDLVAAAHSAGRTPIAGYRAAGGTTVPGSPLAGGSELDLAHGEGFHEVERAALASVSALGSGSRVIAVYEQRWDAPAGPLCVYLHGVGDPGNVGTVLRSALAFGASCVALGPRCADPHSPRAVRASMGAIFSVPLARVRDIAELPGERVALAADAAEALRGPAADSGMDPREALRAHPVTLLVGAEREGLPDELLAACERRARIPIASESLNAAMAATVALYEMTTRSRPPARHPYTFPAA